MSLGNRVFSLSSATVFTSTEVLNLFCMNLDTSVDQNSLFHCFKYCQLPFLLRLQIWNRDSLLLCFYLVPDKYHAWNLSED